jgi:hypothetical protein
MAPDNFELSSILPLNVGTKMFSNTVRLFSKYAM